MPWCVCSLQKFWIAFCFSFEQFCWSFRCQFSWFVSNSVSWKHGRSAPVAQQSFILLTHLYDSTIGFESACRTATADSALINPLISSNTRDHSSWSSGSYLRNEQRENLFFYFAGDSTNSLEQAHSRSCVFLYLFVQFNDQLSHQFHFLQQQTNDDETCIVS